MKYRCNGQNAIIAQLAAQRPQQMRVILAVPGTCHYARQVGAGIFPVDVDAVQAVLIQRAAHRACESPSPFLGTRHLGKTSRTPAAHGQHDAQLRIPLADSGHKADVAQAAQIQHALADEPKGQVQMREPARILPRDVGQRGIHCIGDFQVLHPD